MSLDNILKYEALDWNLYNGEPCKLWSEAGHQTSSGYHPPSVNMEFQNGQRYEFIDKAGYDAFRTDYPNHHRPLNVFGNRNTNKLNCGW